MGFIQKIVSVIGWSVLLFLIFGVIGALLVARGGDSEKLAISTKNAVGLVELEGEINNSKKFRKSLKKFVDNDKIKALVVRIDSPGGAVGASEEMYRAVKNAAEKKPVVCALGNTAASGGLYTAVGCQKIVSNKGTITGSIGVILMTPNVADVVDKVGFKMNVIKSGKFKDSGSPFREMTEDDRGLLQRLANASYEQFVEAVADGRGLSVEAVKKFADGRIILGEEAIGLGLVDEIGGVERAAKIALELTGVTDEEPEIIREKKPEGIFAVLESLEEKPGVTSLFEQATKSQLLFKAFF